MARGTSGTATDAGADETRARGRAKIGSEKSAFALTTRNGSTHEASSAIAASMPSEPTFAVSVAFV